MNKKIPILNLKDLYFEKACLFYPNTSKDFEVFEEFNAPFISFSEYLQNRVKSKTVHAVEDKNGNVLEIGFIKSKLKTNFAYVAAWNNGRSTLKKEVHLVYPLEGDFDLPLKGGNHDPNINQARALWVEFSNSHRPSKLLKVLYTKDAFYFNQGKSYRGFEEIDPKYSYMSNKNWKIKLFPHYVQQISDNRALEIGHYKSSGKGHYIIVWEKNKEGTWQVDFDFNF